MRHKLNHWLKLIFSYPADSFSLLDDEYDAYWEARGREERSLSDWQKQRADIALSLMEEGSMHVADIGSGDGGVLSYIKEKRKGVTGVGIDASDKALTLVKEAGFEASKQDFSLLSGLSIPENDYTLLFEIIEHVKDSEELVLRALESSRKGVFISIPNSGFFPYRLRLLFGKFPAQWVNVPNEHLRFWTLADVKWWLKALKLSKCAVIRTYQGVPLLRSLSPGLFAAGIVIYIHHEKD